MKFTKMQGTGNDFVVVETNDTGRDWSQLAVAVCNRHYGIGADGLLLLMPSAQADFRMRIFNADGSEANTCGNGIRCLVKYYFDSRYPEKTDNKVLIETLTGIREAHVQRSSGRVTGITIGMGLPKSGKNGKFLALAKENIVDIMSSVQYTLLLKEVVLLLELVSIGNSHAVYFTEKPVIEFPLNEIGPEVERHFLPEGMNFEVARLIGDNLIEMRVWEHGVGETLACGSGACATTVAARLLGYVGNATTVSLPGGKLEIQWDGIGEVFLSGPAEFVFIGEWPDTVSYKGKGIVVNNEVLA